jgi:hypothetical protein
VRIRVEVSIQERLGSACFAIETQRSQRTEHLGAVRGIGKPRLKLF